MTSDAARPPRAVRAGQQRLRALLSAGRIENTCC